MNLADLIRIGPAGEQSQKSQESQSQRAVNVNSLRPSARLEADRSQESQKSQSQSAGTVNSLRPSARLEADRSQESQHSQSQSTGNPELERSLPNINNNSKVIIYGELRAREIDSGPFATATLATFATFATDDQSGPVAKSELTPFATATFATFATDGQSGPDAKSNLTPVVPATLATFATDDQSGPDAKHELPPVATATFATFATDGQSGPDAKSELPPFATATLATFATDGLAHRLWDIRTPTGWLEVASCPPASQAAMQATYPEALEIIPAEEDPGTAFYRRLFAGMDAPRVSLTLTPKEAHEAVMAGLVAPEDTRASTLLAYRTPAGCGLMAVDKSRWDGLQALTMVMASTELQ